MAVGSQDDLIKLLDKATKTMDAVGELNRDIRLIRRLHPEWTSEVKTGLQDLESSLTGVLGRHDTWEQRMADIVTRLE